MTTMVVDEFTTPGSHEWTVPDELASDVLVRLWGAGSSSDLGGGNGGYVEATIPQTEVSAGDTLYPYVGGTNDGYLGGFNGGGDSSLSDGSDTEGGAGATDIRIGGETLADRALVGGGGGGGAGGGGAGGYPEGEDGSDSGGGDATGGAGGTQTSGGNGGDGAFSGEDGEDGSFGVGGAGGSNSDGCGGGGGGGWYGGGGGGATSSSTYFAADGGGGSSYYDDSLLTDFSHETGANSGDGRIELEYEIFVPPSDVSVVGERNTEIDLEWIFDSEDDIRIYRDTTSGIDPTTESHIDQIASTESYTDSGLINGRSYYYVATAYNGSEESGPSDEVSGTTTLPAPSLSASGGSREATLSFSAEDDNGDGEIVIYRDGGAVGSVDRDTESYIDGGAELDGQQYEFYLIRDTGDATAQSAVDAAITDLPSVIDLTVESIDGRYVTVSWVDPSNNSSGYRLLLSEDDDGTYQQDGSDIDPVGEDETATHQSTELLDGQLYGATVETFTDDTSVREDQ